MIEWKLKGIFKADAAKVYGEIETLTEVTPEQVVEAAKDTATELHKCFTWDDTIAAHKWRLSEADRLIRMIVVTPDEKEQEAPQFVQRVYVASDENDNRYQRIDATVRNDDAYQKLLEQARRDAEIFKSRYSSIAELREVIETIEAFLR